jgi:hypothetical protein
MTSTVIHLFGGMQNLITMAEGGATVALITLLIVQQFVAVADGPAAPERRNLNLAIMGLLFCFGAICALRLSH